MSEAALREPAQIRRDCAAKPRPVETSGMFTAILGCLLGEDSRPSQELVGNDLLQDSVEAFVKYVAHRDTWMQRKT
jgi:hypothetical protein